MTDKSKKRRTSNQQKFAASAGKDATALKRQMGIRRTKANVEKFLKLREQYGDDAPPEIGSLLDEAQSKLQTAISNPTEFNAHAAASAATMVGNRFVPIGVAVTSGGHKGGDNWGIRVNHENRLAVVAEWKETHPDRQRGWQSKLARHFAEEFDLTVNGAFSYLKRQKLFD